MKSPSVSVVIGSYNTGDFLGEAIESVLSQTHIPDEIIISDVSTDHSPEVVRRHAEKESRIKAVFSVNRGQLSTLLEGVGAASSEWIFFLDSDDCYKPEHVESRLRRISQNPSADIAYGRNDLMGDETLVAELRLRHDHENGSWLGPIDLENAYDWSRGSALAYCLPNYHIGGITATLSVRRGHFAKLPLHSLATGTGGNIMCNADFAILFASALYGGRKLYCPERSVSYRVHPASMNGSYLAGRLESAYLQSLYCHMTRSWLRSRPEFDDSFYGLLDLEMAAVPAIADGHRELYEKAKALGRTRVSSGTEQKLP